MSDNADVRSLDKLEEFLSQSQYFRSKLQAELENLQVEIRRLTAWIEVDATNYWTEQLTRSQRHLVECQDALVRCMSYVREEERRPCTELKKRLRKAQERRALCEERLKTVKAAAQAWERKRNKCHTNLQRCRDLCESDLSVAINVLQGQIETLHQYATLRTSTPGAGSTSKPSAPDAEQPAAEAVPPSKTAGDHS